MKTKDQVPGAKGQALRAVGRRGAPVGPGAVQVGGVWMELRHEVRRGAKAGAPGAVGGARRRRRRPAVKGSGDPDACDPAPWAAEQR